MPVSFSNCGRSASIAWLPPIALTVIDFASSAAAPLRPVNPRPASNVKNLRALRFFIDCSPPRDCSPSVSPTTSARHEVLRFQITRSRAECELRARPISPQYHFLHFACTNIDHPMALPIAGGRWQETALRGAIMDGVKRSRGRPPRASLPAIAPSSSRAALHEEARSRIRRLIVNGQLNPGASLGEAALSQALGMSRTPIREALKLLALEGLVKLHSNRGAF